MSSKNIILATEIESLHKRENEMYNLYSNLFKEIKNEEVKETIKLIRDQELNHIKMVTRIISILGKHVTTDA